MHLPVLTCILQAVIGLLLLASATAMAADKLQIPRAKRAPVLAEYVSGVPADAGVEVSGFRQFEPGDGQPSALETKAYLSYDENNLYVVFVCKDDPKLVRARIARREDLPGDDAVQLDIDSFNDKQRSFRFYANPYGVQMDAKITEGLGPDFEFDTQWKSDGQITPTGYVVKMEIPFKSLRFHRAPVQNWGISVGRIIPRLNEFSYWPYITKRQEAFVPQLAEARINEQISAGRNIQINPYGYLGRSRALNSDNPSAPFWEKDNNNQAGVDAKFVLADAFAVDLTLNPDFSEVETDEPQVIIDKRYEVLFPEKRPFFLENSGFFKTPQPLFFSRRIADPQIGARVTGRHGDWSIGSLLMNDEAPGKLLDPANPDHGKKARIGVARVQKDFGVDSNVGVLVTDRRLGEQSNSVAGVDSRYKINENWVLSGQLAKSYTKDPFYGVDTSGSMGYAAASRSGLNFNYSGQYLDISRDFDTALGFVPRTDIRQTIQNATYLWQFPDAEWLVNAGPGFQGVYTKDHDGVLQDWSTDAWAEVNGLRATRLHAHLLKGYEYFAGLGFHKSGYLVGAKTEWFKWLTAEVELGQNDVINYYAAPGVTPFLGDARNFAINVKVTPTPQFRIDETLFYNDLRTKGAVAGEPAATSVYRSLISRTRFNYQYSRFLAAHLIFDYNFLRANTNLVGFDGSKRLSGDLLFSYVLSPGTTVYAGYTDRQENLALVGNPAVLQRTRDLDLHTGRKVFVKFNYLFQL
jgi:hypothetical protein